MSFEKDLEAAKSGRADAEQIGELARSTLVRQREEDVLPLLAAAAHGDARLLQWKGLLERALDEHAEALKSFAEAARLAPTDAGIAHGHARVALEAGLPAIALFERAFQLAPSNGQVCLGLNAARIAAGKGEQALADLQRVLAQSPMWIEGHQQFAQIQSLLGRREHADDSLDRALANRPQASQLWQALFGLELQAEDYARLGDSVRQARAAGLSSQAIGAYEFIAASELGGSTLPDSILEKDAAAIPLVWLIRHYLRSGRIEQASTVIDAKLGGTDAADILPYAETAWRIGEDPRLDWLTGDPNLVSVIDLGKELAAIPGLTDLLRSLHAVSGRYLNQSVRGGSQTDGPLFSRIEPEIRALRALIVRAVEGHAARFESLPDSHPQKMAAAGRRIRFSGSWSVRLVDGGFHTAHVHPRGWISSALYLGLPEGMDDSAGWLSLGEPPPELGLSLQPTRMIEPKVGQLVLFPSWMWHGTRPFPKGERLTVAFDVASPVA